MALEHMNTTEINIDEGFVRVGNGILFQDLYESLDPYNLTAVIGRVGVVGMGMAVGAGISYQTNEMGFVVDNVLSYEVVLANGTIVEASAESNSDLFWALKGGNNNFGVVTHMKLRTLEANGVFGGLMTYPQESVGQLMDTIYDYHVRQAVEHPKVHALPQYTYNGTTDRVEGVVAVVYNEAGHEEVPEILEGWVEIPFDSNSLKNRPNYTDLVGQVKDTSGSGLA